VTTLGLKIIAEGFTSPVAMAVPDDSTGRLFVVDQIGQVRIIDAGLNLLKEPFLDITDRMVELNTGYDERGLLGMAFHPDYSSNGRFFVFYNSPLAEEDPAEYNCRIRISEFQVSANNPDMADTDKEAVLLEVLNPQMNHNGGQLTFGPDGFLYISIGDGGNANDVGDGHTPDLGNGQDTSNLLGTILRYDADTPGTLNIPPDNPFVGDSDFLDPIYAYGFRNPWRFSFDMEGDQRLFCGDVGQNLYEEVDLIVSGGNYGWNIKEGLHCFDPANPDTAPSECSARCRQGKALIDPIIEYGHKIEGSDIYGTTVIGGYVYRGNGITELGGRYVFGDWSRGFSIQDGSVFLAEEDQSGEWQVDEAVIAGQSNGRLNRSLLSFGQDLQGEIYLLTTAGAGPSGNTGQVLKIVSASFNTIDIDVENFRFDADDNDSTQIDTVVINAGDTVRWIWKEFVHTITSGEGAGAEDAGDLFDELSNSNNPIFSYTFTEAGTYPYFCRPHELLDMKGIIVVQPTETEQSD
jgi:glucose/arabinose dehydrogenase/plastocyanin